VSDYPPSIQYGNHYEKCKFLQLSIAALLLETVELMSKGFFEKIEYMDALSEVSNLAQESRGRWKKEFFLM
jgi:hypothetical protein